MRCLGETSSPCSWRRCSARLAAARRSPRKSPPTDGHQLTPPACNGSTAPAMPAGAAAGIPAVVQRLSSRYESEQADAARELADLLDSPSAQAACLAAGGAHALLHLLHSRDARVKKAASWAIATLADENAAGQAALAAAGAIPPLARLLHASSDDGLLAIAAVALNCLATQNAANAAAVLAASVPRLLQAFLACCSCCATAAATEFTSPPRLCCSELPAQ